ncbi:hypothetical protein R1sor_022537 [Riccia sorocarpa]|uniref:CCHC-type domain-containing protein n=1 Tax=Riccia sorocarpa TaxID=122646 RepID=A0ABD3GLN2_9MARC
MASIANGSLNQAGGMKDKGHQMWKLSPDGKGDSSTADVNGPNASNSAKGNGHTNFANPVFQPSPGDSNVEAENVQVNEKSVNLRYETNFPPLCKTVKTVIPEPIEEKGTEESRQNVQSMNWKATATKSLLERHPQWANSMGVTTEPNPYTRGLKESDGVDVSIRELKEVVSDINSCINVEEYKLGDTIQVEKGFFSCRLRHLQNCAFVLCALDFAPSRDKVTEWARNELWQAKGIQVEQIRILSRGCFLIVTGDAEQQKKALMEGPYKINGRMTFAFPWDPKFSPRELRSKLVPVWVDLPKVHPMLEAYGAHMLATVGKVLYKTCETGRDSYTHIRGCVLTDISRKLKDHVKIQLEGVEEPMVQPIWYTSLPNICFACHQRGHIAKDCPAFREETTHEADENISGEQPAPGQKTTKPDKVGANVKDDNDGFTEVHHKKKSGTSGLVEGSNTSQEKLPGETHIDQESDEDEDEDMNVQLDDPSLVTITENVEEVSTESTDPPENLRKGTHSDPASKGDGTMLDDKRDGVQAFPGEALSAEKTSKAKDKAGSASNRGAGVVLNVTDSKGEGKSAGNKLQGQVHKNTISIKKAARKSGGHPSRLRIARQWLRKNHKDVGVVAFQELKALEENLSFNLGRIWENGRVIVDYAQSGRGGAALLIHPTLQVLDSGIKGDGTAAWAKITTKTGPLMVMSLYAPNNTIDRRALWPWLSFRLEEGNWLVMGDFNSVELPDDTVGPSALLHGSELRLWKALTSEVEMVDAYLCASFTDGPRFTRQVFVGDRLDQARLDRCYLSNGASWCHHVHRVSHVATQTLSDHWLVEIVITLQEAEREVMKRSTYFKMNADSLKNSSTKQEVMDAWMNHPAGVSDPQIKWTLGWSRVKAVLSNKRRTEAQTNGSIGEKRLELAALRACIQADYSERMRSRVLTLEKELRNWELNEAKKWRLRSRVRWMEEGEAPSRYFFTQLRAKQTRDSMLFLRKEDGSETQKESEVKSMVTDYFQDQFTCPEPVPANLHLRNEVLKLVDRQVNEAQNEQLREMPEEKELDELVEELPRDKAPGLDGVTNNMIQDCWDFIRRDCLAMMRHFWETGSLLSKNSQGVIKLLPKNEEKWFLRNWRPITLMGITYKLIGKLLARRLKRLVGFLTSPQQTGFIEGRSIFDNLLGSRLGAEWAEVSSQDALFLKLDFAKAYDRVQHTFMWETLAAMNIDPHFIMLLKGLVTQGSSKVHINGWYTEEINLNRGVRQGCPVAPYLFVLSTQPLMVLFEKAQREGQLTGIKLPGGRQLLHQLFADDTGVHMQADEGCFNTTKTVVETFEKISGAALNLSKSQIIPLGSREVPSWIQNTGCQVAREGDTVVYLGGPIGVGITDGQIVDFLLGKFQKRLGHWSTKILTWAGRVTALRHILTMLPTYHFMTMSLTRHGFKELEKVCRSFLWGFNSEGLPKKSLVGWDTINQPKHMGGLGIGDFTLQADTMKMRLLTRVMQREETEWISLASAILQKQAPGWNNHLEGDFSLQDFLLLGPRPTHRSARTIRWIFSGWYKVRHRLFFSTTAATLPHQLEIWKLEILVKKSKHPPIVNWKKIKAVFRDCNIRTLADLLDRDGRRRILPGLCRILAQKDDETNRSIQQLETWISPIKLGDERLEDSPGWCWDVDNLVIRKWGATNKGWKKLLAPSPRDDSKLYNKWPGSGVQSDWKNRWSALWFGKQTERNKLWVWRLYRMAFFTASRGAKMQVCDGVCERCKQGEETATHLFWSCSKNARRWADLSQLGLINSNRNALMFTTDEFLAVLDRAIFQQQQKPSWFITTVVHTRSIWKERNEWVFRKKESRLPVTECVQEVIRELAVLGERLHRADEKKTVVEEIHRLEAAIKVSAHPQLEVGREDTNASAEEYTEVTAVDHDATQNQGPEDRRNEGRDRSETEMP